MCFNLISNIDFDCWHWHHTEMPIPQAAHGQDDGLTILAGYWNLDQCVCAAGNLYKSIKSRGRQHVLERIKA